MSYTTHVYTKAALSLGTKKIDFTADTFKAIALSAYTVGTTRDTAQFVSDLLGGGSPPATQSAGGTYSAGGIVIPTTAYTLSGHTYIFSGGTIVFSTSSGVSMAYVAIADTTPGSDATNPLIEYWDLGGTQSVLSITPDPLGLTVVTMS